MGITFTLHDKHRSAQFCIRTLVKVNSSKYTDRQKKLITSLEEHSLKSITSKLIILDTDIKAILPCFGKRKQVTYHLLSKQKRVNMFTL